MTTLTTIVGDILTASNTATVTNKTINSANNTLTVRMANDVSGTLPVTNGGSGQTSGFSEGQILIGNSTGNTLTKATLTGGNDICVTNGNGSITIAYCVPIVYNNSLWTWGHASDGGLGDNTTVSKSSPVSVVGGFTDWCQVSGGSNSLALGVRTNGTAWAWGDNGDGELGDSTTVNKSSPISVIGGFTNWSKVSSGANHAVGLRQDGTMWAWGYNGAGQLGTNSTTNTSSPVSVVGGFTDWCQIAAGHKNSFGIRTNGVLYAWGYNNSGRLGINNTENKSSPVSVVGGFTDWCGVANKNHTLAVRTNGTAWAWGCGYHGQLGNSIFGTYASPNLRSSPVSVVGGFTNWCQVTGGFRISLGVRTDGTLYSWGINSAGVLGHNTASNASTNSPVVVVGGFTDWCQVSNTYSSMAVAVRTNGTAWAWGCNNKGQLGTNNTTNSSSPVSVVGGFTDWCQVSATYAGAVGIRSTVV
jgi:alpha-tubulin suppressor-like RCC1 family protein